MKKISITSLLFVISFFTTSFVFAAVTQIDNSFNTTYQTGVPTSKNDTDNTMTVPIDQVNSNPLQNFPPTNYFNDSPQQINSNQDNGNVLNKLINSDRFKGEPLSNLLNQLFWIGLIAAVVLAIIMIIRGGIEYMTIDSIDGKDRGEKRVQASLGGLLLAFSAILILNTINPGLTKLSIKFPDLKQINNINVQGLNLGTTLTPSAVTNWSKDEKGNFIKVQSDGSKLISTPDGKAYTLFPDGTIKEGFITPTGATVPVLNGQNEESVRKYFADNGIAINAPQGTTNVQGLGQGAMTGVVNLKNASGADITITGGTEPGHKTHGVGKSIVDLRKNSTLDSYIVNNAVTSYPRAGYTEYKLSSGATYMNEGDHWHVEF